MKLKVSNQINPKRKFFDRKSFKSLVLWRMLFKINTTYNSDSVIHAQFGM